MNIYSIWPYFATIAMIIMIMATPVFSFVDEPINPHAPRRVQSIDGLRGILAMSVAIHHLVTAYKYHFTGVWGWLPSGFYNQLGEASVSLFFMVTGFLFWKRLSIENGKTDLLRLYVGRFFRIAPMYVLVVLAMFVVVAHRTRYTLNVPISELLQSMAQWLALGIGGSDIPLNGDDHAKLVLAGVTWTIGYEWAFYASLAGLYFVARRRTHLPFAMLAFAISAYLTTPGLGIAGFCLLFSAGMLAASLTVHGFKLSGPVSAIAALLAIAYAVHSSPSTYGHVQQVIALFAFFTIVASGNCLFGILTTRGAERLGNISYSVYLVQGLAITALYGLPIVRSWAFNSPLLYWCSAVMCCIALAAVSAVTFRYIERPAISLGKRVFQKQVHGERSPI
ncbi:hypothetical protein C6T60_24605 [Burkholderia multivorans]|uniref:acyltransferase family protein n=1 Tax=Burkholderia multivorans TaxID=87883 RepID=UPI000D00888A|nr:acyltransferase [Burkholderia multivorans]PRH00532.1 hypothetical protein C6T60_24605 [Burkholderia multivorans]